MIACMAYLSLGVRFLVYLNTIEGTKQYPPNGESPDSFGEHPPMLYRNKLFKKE